MLILVTGATGNVGRRVVTALVNAGVRVRALTRTSSKALFPAGVEVVEGDLSRPLSIAPAFRGVERMYLFPAPATARQVVALAKESGVRRIVVLSSGAVEYGADTKFHLPVEQAVQDSGLEWTHIRPGEFMLNKLWLWGPSIRAERDVRDPFPDAAWYPVHEQDVADAAALVLTADRYAYKAYTLNGPELISHREQAQAISQAIGSAIRFEQVTPERAREIYRAQGGFAAANADFLLGFTDYGGNVSQLDVKISFDPRALPKPATAEAVTGRARSFGEWARDHASDFM